MTQYKHGNWYPIETAPKDGTNLLLFNPTYPHPDVSWLSLEGVTESSSFVRGATHWMPLPEPPADIERKDSK